MEVRFWIGVRGKRERGKTYEGAKAFREIFVVG